MTESRDADAGRLLAEGLLSRIFKIYEPNSQQEETVHFNLIGEYGVVDWGWDSRVKLSFSKLPDGQMRARFLDASNPNQDLWSGVFTTTSREAIEDLISALQKMVA